MHGGHHKRSRRGFATLPAYWRAGGMRWPRLRLFSAEPMCSLGGEPLAPSMRAVGFRGTGLDTGSEGAANRPHFDAVCASVSAALETRALVGRNWWAEFHGPATYRYRSRGTAYTPVPAWPITTPPLRFSVAGICLGCLGPLASRAWYESRLRAYRSTSSSPGEKARSNSSCVTRRAASREPCSNQ